MSNPMDEIRKMRGLWTHPNPLTAPDGALLVADNAEIVREDMVSRRRGYLDFSTNLPDALPKSLFSNGSRTTPFLELDSILWRNGGASWADITRLNNRAFSTISGAWINKSTNVLYLSDRLGEVVWSWNLTTGLARIIGGTWKTNSNAVGAIGVGKMDGPNHLWEDGSGNIYVCDTNNHCIRKIVESTGVISTLAGTPGTPGVAVGGVGVGQFTSPRGIWGDGAGNLFIGDTGNHAIRKVVIATGVISNFAGTIGSAGATNGAVGVGKLSSPVGIWGDASANLYICDTGNTAVRLANTAGTLSSFAALGAFAAHMITGDASAVYVYDEGGAITKITYPGAVQSNINNLTSGGVFGGLAIDASGNLYTGKNAPFVTRIYTLTGQFVTISSATSTVAPLAQANYHGQLLKGPDSRRIKSVEQKGTVLLTSHRGIMKLTASAGGGTLLPAGIPRGLDITATDPGIVGTLLAVGSSRAYRYRFGYRHTNGRVVLGPASTRCVFTNGAAGVRNVNLSLPIPAETPDGAFVQLYASLTSTVTPDDEMALIFERAATATEQLTGLITLTDSTPDVFRGANLETNEKQQGAGQTNDLPPFALCISRQKAMTLYGRTKLPQRLIVQLLGVGGLTNATSTVVINGVTYTCNAAEVTATGTFQKFIAGTDSQNTENTAKSLCNVINKYPGNQDIYAYYVSGPSDPPGRILLQHRYFGAVAWSVIVDSTTTGGAFNPSLPTSGTTVSSNDESKASRLYASKVDQPEHVPWGENFIDVGGDEDGIQAVLELRDSNIVIKDRSVWRVTGTTPQNLQAFPLDNTVAIMGRDTAVVLNNQVFCLTNQGVVAISDTGVQVVSRQIEAMLLFDVNSAVANSQIDQAHAVAQEVERCYRLWLQNVEAGVPIAWKFNTVTMAWTREITHANCATIVQDDVLYGLNNAFGHVLRQRRSQVASVQPIAQTSDPDGIVTVSGASGLTATVALADGVNWSGFSSTYPGIGVGWVLTSGGVWFTITAMNGAVATFNATGITNGTWTAYRPIPMLVEFAPRTIGKNFEDKQFGEVQIVAECENAVSCNVGFVNETDLRLVSQYQGYATTPANVDKALDAFPAAPTDPVGSQPSRRIRVEVARARSRGAQLGVRIYHAQAWSLFNIRSVGIETVDTGGMRAQR